MVLNFEAFNVKLVKHLLATFVDRRLGYNQKRCTAQAHCKQHQ